MQLSSFRNVLAVAHEHFPFCTQHIISFGSSWRMPLAGNHRGGERCDSEVLDRAPAGHSPQGFEFCKALLDRDEVWRMGRQISVLWYAYFLGDPG